MTLNLYEEIISKYRKILNLFFNLFFLSLHREYLGHFITSPHSLIAKILGAFSLKQQKLGRVSNVLPYNGLKFLKNSVGNLGKPNFLHQNKALGRVMSLEIGWVNKIDNIALGSFSYYILIWEKNLQFLSYSYPPTPQK